MRHFMVMFDQFRINRDSVRSGMNHPEVVIAARCVNVGLFLSGDLRRDVVVSLATGSISDLTVVSFNGKTMKRVSPDERSITFFLLKAFDAAGQLDNLESHTLDNGIEVSRGDLQVLLERWKIGVVFIAVAGGEEQPADTDSLDESFYLYYVDSGDRSLNQRLPGFIPIPKPPHPERLLLEVNLRADRHSQSS
jgi:tRNA pseudouridine-54 N-methylase